MRALEPVLVVVALGAVSLVSTAGAQSFLRGIVRDGRSNAPVAGAEIIIADLQLRARTDQRGRFLLDDISGGRFQVVIRKLGYDSASALIPFSGADSVYREFVLTIHAQPLPEVPVLGASTPLGNAKLAEFESRRRFGIGHFLTAADLDKEQDRRLSDVIQKLPGVLIVHPRGGTGPTGGGMAAYVASSRGDATIESVSATFGRTCPVAIWLDGVVVYRGRDRGAVHLTPGGARTVVQDGTPEPPFDINSVNTKTVAAIEFYAGPAQIPTEFNITQGTCGALVIWTK